MTTKLFLTALIAYLFFHVAPIHAQESVAGASASLENDLTYSKQELFYRQKKEVIRKMLDKQGSPLAGATDNFVETCKRYKIDCYLLPAIAGLESGFGKYIAAGTYNPFGWGGGYLAFAGWNDAIDTVGGGLRNNYINRGASTIEAIGAIYAESPTWAARVQNFKRQFEEEEEKTRLYFEGVGVQL